MENITDDTSVAFEWSEKSVEKGVRNRLFSVSGPAKRPVYGAIWSPENSLPNKPLVLLGHGASGDCFQAPVVSMAYRMVRHFGFHAAAIDGPVHGRRQKDSGGRTAFLEEWRRPETVDEMIADWQITISSLQSQSEIGCGPLAYWGLSMGTIYGAPLVASDLPIKAAVLGLMGLTGPTEHYRNQIQAAAEAITCPVLFLIQLEDELFPRAPCFALFDALASEYKTLHANPGLHSSVPREELKYSEQFLAHYLS